MVNLKKKNSEQTVVDETQNGEFLKLLYVKLGFVHQHFFHFHFDVFMKFKNILHQLFIPNIRPLISSKNTIFDSTYCLHPNVSIKPARLCWPRDNWLVAVSMTTGYVPDNLFLNWPTKARSFKSLQCLRSKRFSFFSRSFADKIWLIGAVFLLQ